MTAYIDYGNGYVAYARTTGDVRLQPGHSGLSFPTVEQPVSENAVVDGSVLGSTRIKGRRTVHPLYFRTATRAQIAYAFSPGVARTMTTAIGSMPYYVEDVIFMSANLKGPQEVRIIAASPLACPEGATRAASIVGGGGWAAESVQVQNAVEDGTSGLVLTANEVGTLRLSQKFAATTCRNTAFEYRVRQAPSAAIAEAYLTILDASFAQLHQQALDVSADFTVALHKIALTNPVVTVNGANTHAQLLLIGQPGFTIALAYSNGDYASGHLETPSGSGESAGDDLTFKVYGQVLDAGVGTATFDADTDVPCAPVISCVIGAVGAATLVLTGTGWTTTITGPFVTNDVIVVDARNFTVTVNGVGAIARFVRTGDWPEVSPGSNTFTVAPAAATTVQWKPRRLGLI